MAMFWDPFRDIDRLAMSLADSTQGPRVIPIELYREDERYVLNADLPGIDPASVDVDVDGQLLTIRAERTRVSREGVKWLARETQAGLFQRQLTLGDGIDVTGITAHYDSGVLSVVIPVSERAKPRKVSVTTSGPVRIGEAGAARAATSEVEAAPEA